MVSTIGAGPALARAVRVAGVAHILWLSSWPRALGPEQTTRTSSYSAWASGQGGARPHPHSVVSYPASPAFRIT